MGSGGGVQMCISTHNVDVRRRWVLNATLRPLYPQETNLVPVVQEAGWAHQAALELYGKSSL